MKDRDAPIACEECGRRMDRSMVYNFNTATNEAKNWPYVSDALVPKDDATLKKYKDSGRLVPDGHGGYGVKIESPADYKRVCKEQGVRPLGDYEKITRSQHRPQAAERKRRNDAYKEGAKKAVRDNLKKKGLL